MKKMKLLMSAVAILSLATSSAVFADDFAPGEGMYLGAFVGHAAGHVSAKVEGTDYTTANCALNVTCTTSNTLEVKDGGLALNGAEGGAWIGYGYKMGDLYVGFEGDFAGGGGKFKITSGDALITTNSGTAVADLNEVSAEMKWSGGASGRIGYYVNSDTLLAIRAGISAAKFDTKFADETESFYGGGPAFGASLQSRLSAIDPNLSIKLAASYVDYLTAPVSGLGNMDEDEDGGSNAEVSGAAYNARLGIVYSFFDVNSLF
jgi:opacity protein-like surface antigen